jgi:hypothetical protein
MVETIERPETRQLGDEQHVRETAAKLAGVIELLSKAQVMLLCPPRLAKPSTIGVGKLSRIASDVLYNLQDLQEELRELEADGWWTGEGF